MHWGSLSDGICDGWLSVETCRVSYNSRSVPAPPPTHAGPTLRLGLGKTRPTCCPPTTRSVASQRYTRTNSLLTLDTLSNRPNNQVFTDIDFYDANENVISDSA